MGFPRKGTNAHVSALLTADCRDVLLPLVTDQLSGQLDDHSSRPDHEACVQLLSTVLDILDRKDVVSFQTCRGGKNRAETAWIRDYASAVFLLSKSNCPM